MKPSDDGALWMLGSYIYAFRSAVYTELQHRYEEEQRRRAEEEAARRRHEEEQADLLEVLDGYVKKFTKR